MCWIWSVAYVECMFQVCPLGEVRDLDVMFQIKRLCLCFQQIETCSHLFFSCKFSYAVWYAIYPWLGYTEVFCNEGLHNFLQHGFHFGLGRKFCKVRHLIWHVLVWYLWLLILFMLLLMFNLIYSDWCKILCVYLVVDDVLQWLMLWIRAPFIMTNSVIIYTLF